MHGLIANQLRLFVIDKLGRDAWLDVTDVAPGVLTEAPPSLDVQVADEVIVAAVVRAAALAETPVPEVLRSFGNFLAPALLRVYSPLVKPEWRTLEVIENTEERIHTAVRIKDPSAGPPYLKSRRVADDEVLIHYTSPRKLCMVAEGIAQGLADHFGETVVISQPECMLRGNARCLVSVRLQGLRR
ncbi:MAG: Heme binding domain protein [Gemmatimonadetes bacterium]|nr:Heme binding domain protein [Gemmatimonadota bacterium]